MKCSKIIIHLVHITLFKVFLQTPCTEIYFLFHSGTDICVKNGSILLSHKYQYFLTDDIRRTTIFDTQDRKREGGLDSARY